MKLYEMTFFGTYGIINEMSYKSIIFDFQSKYHPSKLIRE